MMQDLTVSPTPVNSPRDPAKSLTFLFPVISYAHLQQSRKHLCDHVERREVKEEGKADKKNNKEHNIREI